jgi:hypothetical protein
MKAPGGLARGFFRVVKFMFLQEQRSGYSACIVFGAEGTKSDALAISPVSQTMERSIK